MRKFSFTIAAATLFAASIAQGAEPVSLTVGYQPYDTISYSAVVIRGLELWKKHLPPGSTVDFESALQGAIIVNAMLADKQQIGYLGDMPAVVSTTKIKQAPIKLVASTGLSAGQRCNVIMVRADAPQFRTPEEAVKWLDGKTIATPRGSCADRFLRQVIEMAGIKPKEVLNQSIEVIATNFRANRIDAATLWEPSVSRIGDFVGEGIAREVVTGHNFNMPDGGFIAMREDFMKKKSGHREGLARDRTRSPALPSRSKKLGESIGPRAQSDRGHNDQDGLVLALWSGASGAWRFTIARRKTVHLRRTCASAPRHHLHVSP